MLEIWTTLLETQTVRRSYFRVIERWVRVRWSRVRVFRVRVRVRVLKIMNRVWLRYPGAGLECYITGMHTPTRSTRSAGGLVPREQEQRELQCY